MSIAAIVPRGGYKLGASGPGVRALQLALARLGYPLTGTGYFGTATDTAVEAFQRTAGLAIDGEVGGKTAAAIDAALEGGAPPASSPAHVDAALPLWLQAGIRLIGTKEGHLIGKRDNQAIIDWAHDLGGDIAAEYTHDSIPWCALFANHCLMAAGLKGTGTLWALDFAGKWPSVKLAGPAVGAFAPMLRSGGGHIVQIVGKDQHGNFMCLGGNQSDAVNIEPFPVSRLNKGFWWPSSVTIPKATGMSALPVVNSNGRVSSNEA